jgi:hypothetical protein
VSQVVCETLGSVAGIQSALLYFLPYPLLRQPFLGSIREDSYDKLFSPIAIAPSKFDVGAFGLVIILRLVKSKGHSFRPGCKNAKCPDKGRKPGHILAGGSSF